MDQITLDIILRDYQDKLIQDLRSCYTRGLKAPLLQLATGGGKTIIFCFMTLRAIAKGNPVLILVHRKELLYQASESLNALGVRHGLIMAGERMNAHEKVQVASKDTLIHRMHRLQWLRPAFIVIDEAHHATAGTWKKILDFYRGSWLLGVTATPCRLDGKGLGLESGGVFDSLICGPSMRQLINDGHLCDYDLYGPPVGIDLSDIKTIAGDYAKDQLNKALNKASITGCAVDHYKTLADGRPALAFCVSVAHAIHVAEQFKEAGYRATSICGTTDKHTRKKAIADLGNGRLDILASCDIISEGTDIPIVEVAILLRPTQSVSLYLQQVGRVLRPGPDKKAIILDHVGNIMDRHGAPDQEREWTLDGKRKRITKKTLEEIEVKIRQCPECFKCHTPGPQCPKCLYVYPIKSKEPAEKAGTLKRLSPADLIKAAAKRKAQIEKGCAKTLVQLVQLGVKREYANPAGWAAHVMRCRMKKKQGIK